jgi:hypothetical protein
LAYHHAVLKKRLEKEALETTRQQQSMTPQIMVRQPLRQSFLPAPPQHQHVQNLQHPPYVPMMGLQIPHGFQVNGEPYRGPMVPGMPPSHHLQIALTLLVHPVHAQAQSYDQFMENQRQLGATNSMCRSVQNNDRWQSRSRGYSNDSAYNGRGMYIPMIPQKHLSPLESCDLII